MAEETPKQRRNRELGELLQELRVAIPGVQVLFAFLLTVPFQNGYKDLGVTERRVYYAAVIAAAVSSLLLIAPAANHRLLFRDHTKERLLRAANRLAIAGLLVLALGIGLSLYLVASVVYGTTVAVVTSVAIGAVTAFAWFLFPRLLHEVEQDHPAATDD